jgi:hypothetical protein
VMAERTTIKRSNRFTVCLTDTKLCRRVWHATDVTKLAKKWKTARIAVFLCDLTP